MAGRQAGRLAHRYDVSPSIERALNVHTKSVSQSVDHSY